MAEQGVKCPNCGLEFPEALLALHVSTCEAEPDEGAVDLDEEEIKEIEFQANAPDYLDALGTAGEREDSGGLMEPDLDDEFARLVGMLDLSDVGPMVPEVVVTTLDDEQLSRRYNEVREELMQRGEMLNCSTQTGRDLHSQRAAYIIEMRKRGMMQ